MKKIFSGKATRQSVSVPLDMMEEVQRLIQKSGNNFSAYIQALIEKDLTGRSDIPAPTDNKALVHLAKGFHPTTADEIQKWSESMDGFQQPFFLYKVLNALHDAILNHRSEIIIDLPKSKES